MEEMDTRKTMTLKELETNINNMIPDLAMAAERPKLNPFASKLELNTLDKIQVKTTSKNIICNKYFILLLY